MRFLLHSIPILLVLFGVVSATETEAPNFDAFEESLYTITPEQGEVPPPISPEQNDIITSIATIDSAKIYRNLATKYAMDADHGSESQAYALLFTIYGVFATAAGIGLFAIDYKGSFFQYPGYGLGGALIGTGAIALFMDILVLPIAIFSSPSKDWKKSEEYNKKADEWELKVKPAINFTEPGAGLLMELQF